jgi:hypothetical protein
METDHIFKAALLLQEYIIHCWVAMEHSCLMWIHENQKKLCAELYSGIVDALHKGVNLASVGKKIVLPASFTSRPCFNQQNLQNALALLHKFGGCDLFITFTVNLAWHEVQEELLPNQSAHEYPDLIAQAFHLKVESFLDDMMNKHIFGEAVRHVYTVEYQKHGISHIHLLLFLNFSLHLSTPEAVDKFISTEIPHKTSQP